MSAGKQMQSIDPTSCRIDTLVAALLYLMTAYQRQGCRKLALSIAAHLDCLAQHPDAGEDVRQVAAGMHSEWKRSPALPAHCVAASKAVH